MTLAAGNRREDEEGEGWRQEALGVATDNKKLQSKATQKSN